MNLHKHLIFPDKTIYEVLTLLNELGTDLNMFVVNNEQKLIGSITDGDIRRGIISGARLDDPISRVMNSNFSFLYEHNIDHNKVIEKRKQRIRILPLVNNKMEVIGLLNFRLEKTKLPIDAVIMAGGKGTRLLPLTQKKPKPLLKVGDKPIISYGIDRMMLFGIKNISITVNYLKEQIIEYAKNYSIFKSANINCISEDKPLGTLGSIKLIEQWHNDYILVTNSDLLTNIDYEDFFISFLNEGADMMVASVPYTVKVPYAILESENKNVKSFKEKPEFTYQANTGIYLLKKKLLSLVPDGEFFNATDLMDKVINSSYKLAYYPMLSYWLDIGKHDDFKKAQEDIKHLKF